MPRKNDVLFRPFLFALLGALFCFWSVQGNDVNFCNTAGCNLYHDQTVAGLSLWWYGFGTFCILGLLALFGPAGYGLIASGLSLFGDVFLLALMSVTAPCLNCLVAGLLFALTYRSFLSAQRAKDPQVPTRISILLSVWIFFFCLNVGAVVRSELGPWAIQGEPEEAEVHIYFSPSCPHCRDAVSYYAGSVRAAFYPLADDPNDVYKTLALMESLNKGTTLDEALKSCQNASAWSWAEEFTPSNLLLRLRMLRNKAHVFSSGSQGVPFFEYRGLPRLVGKAIKSRRTVLELKDEPETEKTKEQGQFSGDLPGELSAEPLTNRQCTSNRPCP